MADETATRRHGASTIRRFDDSTIRRFDSPPMAVWLGLYVALEPKLELDLEPELEPGLGPSLATVTCHRCEVSASRSRLGKPTHLQIFNQSHDASPREEQVGLSCRVFADASRDRLKGQNLGREL
jgi:hypothetical protein